MEVYISRWLFSLARVSVSAAVKSGVGNIRHYRIFTEIDGPRRTPPVLSRLETSITAYILRLKNTYLYIAQVYDGKNIKYYKSIRPNHIRLKIKVYIK